MRGRLALLAAAALALAPLGAAASSDPLVGLISANGGAGVGFAVSLTRSPYVDGGVRNDLIPLYLYENDHIYLHAYRVGLKFDRDDKHDGFDLFLTHRFEGFPSDRIPTALAGMTAREPGMDAGVGYERHFGWGTLYGEALRDVSHTSGGNEVRLGYTYDWQRGRLRLRPYFMVSLRSARLNNYYYGVRPGEATPTRPAYQAGAGFNNELGLYGSYRVTERWRLLAGVSATRLSTEIRDSPIVRDRMQLTAMAGVLYDFSPKRQPATEGEPLILKLLYGKSTDCNLMPIMGLSCTSTSTVDQTRVYGIEIGRPFVRRLNGWPLDFVGYLGLLRHDERGLQPDSWEFNAYVKGYWYGFPWDDRVRTRIGFGAGLSYAQRIPYVEARDQARRGLGTSRLLNYLDPSIDVSIGDLLGKPSLREAYFGFGVTHRSGIFGSSQLLGNVNGGSNYIYTYVEWPL